MKKKIKKSWWEISKLILLIAFFIGKVEAQEYLSAIQADDTTYYQIVEAVDSFFDVNPPVIDEPFNDDRNYDQFYKWAYFWQNRLDSLGRPELIHTRMSDFLDELGTLCQGMEENTKDWKQLGPFNSDDSVNHNLGRIEAISVDPDNPDIILVGGMGGGIWKTTDGGQSWVNKTDEEGFSIFGVREFERHPQNKNYIYAATGSAYGIWGLGRSFQIGIIFSNDGGESWVKLNDQKNISSIVIDPASTLNATTIYLGVNGRPSKVSGSLRRLHGAYNSLASNNMVHCSYYHNPFNFQGVEYNDVEIDHSRNLWFTNQDGIYKIHLDSVPGIIQNGVTCQHDDRVDNYIIPNGWDSSTVICGGDTFPEIFRQLTNLEINHDGDIVFLTSFYFRTANTCQEIKDPKSFAYVSENEGLSWSAGAEIPSEHMPHFDNFIAVSPHNSNLIYYQNHSGRKVNRFFTQSQTVENMNEAQIHRDVRVLHAYKGQIGDTIGEFDEIYVGTDGGIARTSNGEDWIDISIEGLACTNYYGIGVDEKRSDYYILGAQDGSINFYNKGVWEELFPTADHGDVEIYEGNNDSLILGYNHGIRGIDLLTGNSLPRQLPEGTNRLIVPFKVNPAFEHELFVGGKELVLTTNKGLSWNVLTNFEKGISSVEISPDEPNAVFFSVHGFWCNENNPPDSGENLGGIYKAVRNGTAWVIEDITSNLRNKVVAGFSNKGLHAPISDIAVDPFNADRIFVCFGGLDEDTKVFKTEDGGQNWIDLHSSCLPNIPFTTIVYQVSSDDKLYLGSDFGVFYGNNTNDWAHYGSQGGLRAMVADMEVNHCTGKLAVATQGRGLWEIDLMENDDETELSGNHVWTTDRKFYTDLRIKSGASLSLEGNEVNMIKGTKITVERGAKLILDGATITNGCDNFWRGIQVQGNYHLAQPAIYDQGGQIDTSFSLAAHEAGVVILLNGSSIQNAKNAISTLDSDQQWPQAGDYWGGIIYAENSSFINNGRAVEFMKYPFENQSRFLRCRFEENADYPFNTNSVGVTIWDCDSIVFEQDTFVNFDDAAILNFDANTFIKGGNVFDGNEYGVEAYNTYGMGGSVHIGDANGDTTTFVNQGKYQVHYSGTGDNTQTVMRNCILDSTDVGVRIVGRNNLDVRNNDFRNSTIGVVLLSTDTMIVNVSCNDFMSEIDQGVIALARNKEASILENSFNTKLADVHINSPFTIGLGSIRNEQGAISNPAGNCFTPGGTDIVAEVGSAEFFTYHADTTSLPCYVPNSAGNYALSGSIEEANNCPQGVGTTRFISGEFDQEEKDFINALKSENYSLAQSILNYYSQGTQDKIYFKEIQQINLNRLSQGTNFVLNSADSLKLEEVATANTSISAYARSIMMYLKGIRYDVAIPQVPNPGKSGRDKATEVYKMTLHPNPTQNEFVVKVFIDQSIFVDNIEIYDMNGFKMMDQKYSSKARTEYIINTVTLVSGVYLVNVTLSNGDVISDKILIQK